MRREKRRRKKEEEITGEEGNKGGKVLHRESNLGTFRAVGQSSITTELHVSPQACIAHTIIIPK